MAYATVVTTKGAEFYGITSPSFIKCDCLRPDKGGVVYGNTTLPSPSYCGHVLLVAFTGII